jgi:hypothetical protein
MTPPLSTLRKIATSDFVRDDRLATRQCEDVFHESLTAPDAPNTGVTLRSIKDWEERRNL